MQTSMKFCGNSSAFTTALLLDKGLVLVLVAPLSIGLFLPAGWDLPPFEDQFTFWWVSEYWFQKGILFLCIYTFTIQKGSSLLTVAWKTVWGSSTTDITRTTAELLQGNGDTWAHSHQPTPTGMWWQSPTAAIQSQGERRVSCLQMASVGHR